MEPTSNQDLARANVDRMSHTAGDPIPAAAGERALETLIGEIRRYLAVVEVFRSEGCEPRWAGT